MNADTLSALEPSRVRVLLVDDNEDDAIIVRDLLAEITTRQFDLQWVESYDAARGVLTDGAPDICLVDYGLGEFCVINLLHEFSDGTVPFVLLTGIEDYEADAAAASAGAADYLVKGHINAPLCARRNFDSRCRHPQNHRCQSLHDGDAGVFARRICGQRTLGNRFAGRCPGLRRGF
jgi:DNA-binding response OmpR family regulator